MMGIGVSELVVLLAVVLVLVLFVVAGVIVVVWVTRSRSNSLEGTHALPGVTQQELPPTGPGSDGSQGR
jgi:flagellar basal body-associated protein FliL